MNSLLISTVLLVKVGLLLKDFSLFNIIYTHCKRLLLFLVKTAQSVKIELFLFRLFSSWGKGG